MTRMTPEPSMVPEPTMIKNRFYSQSKYAYEKFQNQRQQFLQPSKVDGQCLLDIDSYRYGQNLL